MGVQHQRAWGDCCSDVWPIVSTVQQAFMALSFVVWQQMYSPMDRWWLLIWGWREDPGPDHPEIHLGLFYYVILKWVVRTWINHTWIKQLSLGVSVLVGKCFPWHCVWHTHSTADWHLLMTNLTTHTHTHWSHSIRGQCGVHSLRWCVSSFYFFFICCCCS